MGLDYDASIYDEILGPIDSTKPKIDLDEFDGDQTKALQYVFGRSAAQIAQVLCSLAEEGNIAAIREFNRLALPKNGMQSYIEFEVPDNIDQMSIDDITNIFKSILISVGKRELSIEQAKELSTIVESLMKSIEVRELGQKLSELEDTLKKRFNANSLQDVRRNFRLIDMQEYQQNQYRQAGSNVDDGRFKLEKHQLKVKEYSPDAEPPTWRSDRYPVD